MPITIENAVVANAVRLFQSICGMYRYTNEFFAAAFRWICNRRFAASCISFSRCSFLLRKISCYVRFKDVVRNTYSF